MTPLTSRLGVNGTQDDPTSKFGEHPRYGRTQAAPYPIHIIIGYHGGGNLGIGPEFPGSITHHLVYPGLDLSPLPVECYHGPRSIIRHLPTGTGSSNKSSGIVHGIV